MLITFYDVHKQEIKCEAHEEEFRVGIDKENDINYISPSMKILNQINIVGYCVNLANKPD